MQVPYLTYSDIKKEAFGFLSTYHSSLSLPIPIEQIIDVQLGINIFPLPRLYRDHGQNGYLSHDRTTIYVDDLQYDQFNEKYRFTLAHELGHFVLHEECYKSTPFTTLEEYKSWRLSVDPEKIGWLDTHAQWFAGLVLVPTAPLKDHCLKIMDKYKSKFTGTRCSVDDFLSYAAIEISRAFEVSPATVETQIRKDNLAKELTDFWQS